MGIPNLLMIAGSVHVASSFSEFIALVKKQTTDDAVAKTSSTESKNKENGNTK